MVFIILLRILQKAIEKPLLYQGRKFDVRVWVLITPHLEIYFYNTPYIRTSSNAYNIDSMQNEIHLTNNTQQKQLTEYSKYEEGNTLPFYDSLLAFLRESHPDPKQILDTAVGRMK